jgi:hypothetical protein
MCIKLPLGSSVLFSLSHSTLQSQASWFRTVKKKDKFGKEDGTYEEQLPNILLGYIQ